MNVLVDNFSGQSPFMAAADFDLGSISVRETLGPRARVVLLRLQAKVDSRTSPGDFVEAECSLSLGENGPVRVRALSALVWPRGDRALRVLNCGGRPGPLNLSELLAGKDREDCRTKGLVPKAVRLLVENVSRKEQGLWTWWYLGYVKLVLVEEEIQEVDLT